MKLRTCLIFDLDGTLVDSVPDLTSCINRVLAKRSLGPLTVAQITRMVGDGAPALLQRVFAFHGEQPDANAMDDFLTDYKAHAADRSVPYPGVEDTLKVLAGSGYVMGVCTNKPEAPARKVLQELGLDGFFKAVSGGDSFPERKPDPRHLLGTIAAAGGIATDAVMIGDHINDIEAAAGARVPAIFAAWGYGPAEMGKGARFVAQNFREVPGLVKRIAVKGSY